MIKLPKWFRKKKKENVNSQHVIGVFKTLLAKHYPEFKILKPFIKFEEIKKAGD